MTLLVVNRPKKVTLLVLESGLSLSRSRGFGTRLDISLCVHQHRSILRTTRFLSHLRVTLLSLVLLLRLHGLIIVDIWKHALLSG